MSVLTYNGIAISLPHTTQFRQEAVLTDDQTDYLYTHVFIEVHGVINVNLPPHLAAETPSETMTRIRGLLETPRKQLTYLDGDIVGTAVPLINVTGINNPVAGVVADIHNGPYGKVFNLTQIGTGTTYLIIFAVECWIHECPGSTVVPLILAHRWEERQSVDDKFVSTYTRTGKIYASSQTAPQPTDRDGRIATAVPLRKGFRRDSAEYILQADGLALMYTIRDVEVFRQAPPNAVRADGYMTLSSPNGAIYETSCYVHLWGRPSGDQKELIKNAIIIVVDKLGIPTINPQPDPEVINLPQAAAAGAQQGLIGGGLAPGGGGAGALAGAVIGQIIGAGIVGGDNFGGAAGAAAGAVVGGGQAGAPAGSGPVITKATPATILKAMSIRQRLYDNEVEVTMTIQQEGPTKRDGAANVVATALDRLSVEPIGSPQQGFGPLPNVRGQDGSYSAQTAQQLVLFAAALADPCLRQSILQTKPPANQNTLVTTRPSFFRTGVLNQGTVSTFYSKRPNALYTDYEIRSYHRLRTFTEQLPTAAPQGNGKGIASIVTLADPATDLIIEWTAESSGDMPECPHWNLKDANVFLVDRQIWPEAPDLRASGTNMKNRISGKYVYVMADATKEVLMAGLFPWLDSNSAANLVVIPGGAFRSNIISTAIRKFIPIALPQG